MAEPKKMTGADSARAHRRMRLDLIVAGCESRLGTVEDLEWRVAAGSQLQCRIRAGFYGLPYILLTALTEG